MSKLMGKLLLSCKKATELMEKRTYFGLKPHEHVQLFLHSQLCDACRNYEKQSKAIHQLLIKQLNDNKTDLQENNPELKEDIKNKIDKI